VATSLFTIPLESQLTATERRQAFIMAAGDAANAAASSTGADRYGNSLRQRNVPGNGQQDQRIFREAEDVKKKVKVRTPFAFPTRCPLAQHN